jgi:hypothetical protein
MIAWASAHPKEPIASAEPAGTPNVAATVILRMSQSVGHAIVAGQTDRDACPMQFRAIHASLLQPSGKLQRRSRRSPA